MNITKFMNHNELIPFYSERGIEISDSFENDPDFSFIIEDNKNIIAAITCSKIDNTYIIEAIAVDEKYERQRIGTKLIQHLIKFIESIGGKEIILNAKNTLFFEKNDFKIIDKIEVPVDAYSYCFECLEYQKNCFPKIMRYKSKE